MGKKNTEIIHAIEVGFVDYLRAISVDRELVLTKKLGWVKTFPTIWSNFIFYANYDSDEVVTQISEVCKK